MSEAGKAEVQRRRANVTLRQLRAFEAAAACGSFSQAAAELGVTQSGFSLLIREFERQLGLRMFDRTTRRVALTAAGQEFLPRAKRLLDDLDDAYQDLLELRDLQRGRVAVAALPSIAAGILPPLLHRFRAANPSISVRIEESHADLLAEKVEKGEADFAIGAVLGERPPLAFRELARDHLVGVFQPAHPLAQRQEVVWEELLDVPYISISDTSSVQVLAHRAFQQVGIQPQPSLTVEAMTTAIALVKAGLGFTLVPESALAMLRTDDLAVRRVLQPSIHRDIAVFWSRSRSLSPAAEALLEALFAGAQGPGSG